MNPAQDTHSQLLEALLGAVPFEGWTEQALRRAASNAGLDDFALHRLAPSGIEYWLDAFSTAADDAMAQAFHMLAERETLRIPQKIRALILARFAWLLPHREAERRAIAHALLAPLPALKRLHRTLDRMWRLAGDTSTDWNWYSKRIILGGVWTTTLQYWLNDTSPGQEATAAFLDRRLADAHRLGTAIRRRRKQA